MTKDEVLRAVTYLIAPGREAYQADRYRVKEERFWRKCDHCGENIVFKDFMWVVMTRVAGTMWAKKRSYVAHERCLEAKCTTEK